MTLTEYTKLVNNCQPSKNFKSDWSSYTCRDFGNTFLPSVYIIKNNVLSIYDGVGLFKKKYINSKEAPFLIDSIVLSLNVYTFPKDVKAAKERGKLKLSDNEICIFIEIDPNDQIETSFKFGNMFRTELSKYTNKFENSFKYNNIENKIFITNTSELITFFNHSKVNQLQFYNFIGFFANVSVFNAINLENKFNTLSSNKIEDNFDFEYPLKSGIKMLIKINILSNQYLTDPSSHQLIEFEGKRILSDPEREKFKINENPVYETYKGRLVYKIQYGRTVDLGSFHTFENSVFRNSQVKFVVNSNEKRIKISDKTTSLELESTLPSNEDLLIYFLKNYPDKYFNKFPCDDYIRKLEEYSIIYLKLTGTKHTGLYGQLLIWNDDIFYKIRGSSLTEANSKKVISLSGSETDFISEVIRTYGNNSKKNAEDLRKKYLDLRKTPNKLTIKAISDDNIPYFLEKIQMQSADCIDNIIVEEFPFRIKGKKTLMNGFNIYSKPNLEGFRIEGDDYVIDDKKLKISTYASTLILPPVELTIEFYLNKFDISKPGENQLMFHLTQTEKQNADKVIKDILIYLKQFENIAIKILGHTSIEGSETSNLKLSLDRATKFKDYITSNNIPWPNLKLDAKRVIEVIGRGSKDAKDKDKVNKQDRRIEIIYVEK